MAHAQKPDLVFQGNGRVHLNRRGSQLIRLLAAEVCASAVVMIAMMDTPCSEVECKTTGYPLHSPASPSLPLPCVTACHQVSTELYSYLLEAKSIYSTNSPPKWNAKEYLRKRGHSGNYICKILQYDTMRHVPAFIKSRHQIF